MNSHSTVLTPRARYAISMATVRSMESRQQEDIIVTLMRMALLALGERRSEDMILAPRVMKEKEVMKIVMTMSPMKMYDTEERALSIEV